MAAVRDHPERPPALQRHVLHSLALRLDWQTGCGFASGAQLAADADCEQRTVKRATSWARGAQLLVQTRRGHYVSAECKVSSEWRLCLPAEQTQGDSGDLLAGKPRGQSTGPKVTADPTQGDSSTPPSRPRSSRPRTSARGDAAGAARPPHAHPETPFRSPPCQMCGRPFSQEQLADPEFRELAIAGAVLCSAECHDADGYCQNCGAERNDDDAGPLCPLCRNGANRQGNVVALRTGARP